MKTKKLNKKILAVLMTMMMCMSGFQVTAFADVSADAPASVTSEAVSTDSSADSGSESSSASDTGSADVSDSGTGSEAESSADSSGSDPGTVSGDTAAGSGQMTAGSQNSFVSSGNDIVIVDGNGNVTINNNTSDSNNESSAEGTDSEAEGDNADSDVNTGSGEGTGEESNNADADSSTDSEEGTDSETKDDNANGDADSEEGTDSETKDDNVNGDADSEEGTNNESGISAEEAQANVEAAKAEVEQAEAAQAAAKGEADSAAADVAAAGADVDKAAADLTAAEEAVANAASEEEAAQAAAKLEEVKAALSQAEAKLAEAKAKADSANASLAEIEKAVSDAKAKLEAAEAEAEKAANQGAGGPAGGGAGGDKADSDKEQGDVTDEEAEKPEEEKPEEKPDLEADEAAKLQAFIDAAAQLPETVTEENYEAVEAMLENLLVIFGELTEEQQISDGIMTAYTKALALWEQVEGVKAELLDTTVATIGETAYDTLQDAVKKAQTGDVINLMRDITESVLLPTSVTINLNGHTWKGDGRATLSIAGLRTGPEVTLQNGTIIGAEGYRAVVVTNGNLTVDGITFNPSGSLQNEGLQSSNFGGGCIYIEKGTLNVNNCIFSGDAGTYKESASYMGAGKFVEKNAYGSHIYVGSDVSDVNLANSIFEKSESTFGAVAVFCKVLTVSGCTFTDNGNGLQLSNSNGVFNITDSTFNKGSKAINAAGGSKMTLNITKCNFTEFAGGPVVTSNGMLNITGGSFVGNHVDSNGVVQLGGGSLVMEGTALTGNTSGGVVKTYSAANVTMRNVTATGNTGTTSMNSGGSVLNANSISGKTVILENVTATNNEQTKEHGGAFYLGGSSNNASTVIEIKGCTITGNTAKNGGGGIYINNKGTTTITDTIITGNTANGTGKYAGGGIYVGSTSGTVTLAGSTKVYNNETPKATVKHLTVGAAADIALVSNNVKTDFASEDAVQRATLILDVETSFTGEDGITYTLTKSDAKGLHYSSGSGSSKKYYWPVGYYTVKVEPASVYLNAPTDGKHTASDTVILSNDLVDAVNQAKINNAKTIYVCGNADVNTENVAALNSGLAFVRCAEHPNGHMFTIKDKVILDNAHIDGNKVDGNSAMISVPSSGHLTITGDTLIENGKNAADKGEGGAIYVHQGGLTMTGGTIDNNSAREGGGIYAYSSLNGNKIVFEGGTVSNNTATGGNGGGGAYIGATSSEFGVNGGRTYFTGNISNQLGGGVFLVNGTNAKTHHYIYKATFTGNKSYRPTGSYYDGGAIYIQSGTTAHMKNVYVSGNTDGDPYLAHNNYTAVAVCPSGELAVYELEGLLAVNNNGKVDIGVVAGGQVSSVDPMVYLPSYAPGGGQVSYTYSNGTKVDLSDHQFMKGYFKVKTETSDSAIQAALETAEADGVVITGNYATQYGAGIMTNGILKIGTETTSLRVNKVWADGNENHENDQILVYLTKDGKIVDEDFRDDSSVILNKDNNWSYIWTNLGNEFTWGVKEASVNGYTSEVKVEKDTEFSAIADKYYIATITNTPGNDNNLNKLVITKNAYGLDPDGSYKFTVKLNNVGDGAYAIQLDGTLYPIYNNEITFYLKDQQSAVIDGLPDGFTYEVNEEEGNYLTAYIDSETEDIDGTIKTVDVVNIAKTNITVKKLWNDEGFGYTGIRPESITIKLMNGEFEEGKATITADENGEWTYTFTDLPKYDAEGNEIQYTVVEVIDDNSHYKPNYNGGNAGWEITNNLKSGSLIIHKEVKGDVDSEKEYKFTITGPHNYKVEKTINGAGNIEITNLVPGEYTVTEQDADIDGYKWTVEGNGVTVNVVEDTVNGENAEQAEESKKAEVTITNTYQKLGELTIQKAVNIDADGEAEALAKTYTFKVTGPNGYDKTVTITGRGSATLEKLEPGTYTVTEIQDGVDINIAGYNLTVSGEGNVEVEYDKTSDITITNTYDKPKEPENPGSDPSTGSLTIVKNVQGVTGDLLLNHEFRFTVTGPEGYSETVTITGNGSKTLDGLKAGTYTVTEDSGSTAISGYVWNGVTVSGEGVASNEARVGSIAVSAGESAAAAVITFTNTYRRPSTPTDPGDPTPPTPSTPENPPTEVPDPDVPLVNIPEEEPPLSEIPEEEPPLANIPDEEPPLVEIPEEEPPLSEIPDEEPPLADMPPTEIEILDREVPKTGDTSATLLWIVMSLMALFGMGTVLTESCVRRRRK